MTLVFFLLIYNNKVKIDLKFEGFEGVAGLVPLTSPQIETYTVLADPERPYSINSVYNGFQKLLVCPDF